MLLPKVPLAPSSCVSQHGGVSAQYKQAEAWWDFPGLGGKRFKKRQKTGADAIAWDVMAWGKTGGAKRN